MSNQYLIMAMSNSQKNSKEKSQGKLKLLTDLLTSCGIDPKYTDYLFNNNAVHPVSNRSMTRHRDHVKIDNYVIFEIGSEIMQEISVKLEEGIRNNTDIKLLNAPDARRFLSPYRVVT